LQVNYELTIMRIKKMVFLYNKKKPQNTILKTLEQYWILNSMYEPIDDDSKALEQNLAGSESW
jgi:hypothetical protein